MEDSANETEWAFSDNINKILHAQQCMINHSRGAHNRSEFVILNFPFCIADLQLFEALYSHWSICPSTGQSIGLSLGLSLPNAQVESVKTGNYDIADVFLCVCVWVQTAEGGTVWIGVVCACPPVRNNTVTPLHLSFILIIFYWNKQPRLWIEYD